MTPSDRLGCIDPAMAGMAGMTDPLAKARREIEGLRQRLSEAQDTIRAIQGGEVDALVVDAGPPQVFLIDPADKPYRLLVEQMHQSAAMLTVDGTVLACNEHFASWLRCEREALRGRPLLEWVEAPDRPLVAALLREGLAASVEREVVLRRGDGERLPAVLGVRALHEGVVGACLLVVDLSEQKRRERLIADGALARAILEQAADAVMVCDIGGTVLRASLAVHDLCGTNPLYQPFHQIGALTRQGERVDLAAVWRGEALRGLEVVYERPGGGRAEMLLSASPLVAAGGERLGVVITLTDITALRAVQDELRRQTTELQQNDRRKDEFLAMLAHELRNPLSPIQSSLENPAPQSARRSAGAPVSRRDRAPGRAAHPAGRRPARGVADQHRQDRAANGAGRPRGGGAAGHRDQPAGGRRQGPPPDAGDHRRGVVGAR